MRKLLLIAVIGLSLGSIAQAEQDNPAGITTDFSPVETSPEVSAATVDSERGQLADETQVSVALSALRAEHTRQLQDLSSAMALASNGAEQESIGREMTETKERQQREEWQLLLEEAELNGDTAYAARLRDVLAPREAVRSTVTTIPVRDPKTGEQIGETEVTR